MLMYFLGLIFCSLGIYGFFTGNIVFLYIGMSVHIIETLISYVSGQLKGFPFILLWIFIAFGGTFNGQNFIEILALCFCFENVVLSIIGGITFLIALACTKISSSENDKIIINELVQQSSLPYDLCCNIYDILIQFKNNNKSKAFQLIDEKLIPNLISNNNISQVGIAFGMLINDEIGLAKEEANNYSEKVISNILEKQKESIPSTNKWQEYLDNHYKPVGTTTTMSKITLSSSEFDDFTQKNYSTKSTGKTISDLKIKNNTNSDMEQPTNSIQSKEKDNTALVTAIVLLSLVVGGLVIMNLSK